MKVVDHKTRTNKTKLAQTVGTRLVDKCTKFGNIRITGRGAKHVLAWMPRVCMVTAKKPADKKKQVSERMLLPPPPKPKMPSPPPPATSNTSGLEAWCRYHNEGAVCRFL